jgi:hypothetical protein
VRGESCLANEIADAFAASQPPRPVDQFSHGPRLPVWFCGRKFAIGRTRPMAGSPNLTRFEPAA